MSAASPAGQAAALNKQLDRRAELTDDMVPVALALLHRSLQCRESPEPAV